MIAVPASRGPHRTSLPDTVLVLLVVLLPTFAKGLMRRRPRVVRWLARIDADGRAMRALVRLRRKYGSAPLTLALPGRTQTLVLDARDLRRVLEGAPAPFSPASREKRATLAHFEPGASLITDPPARAARRRFNEEALLPETSAHPLAAALVPALRAEAETLVATGPTLTWDAFLTAWNRAARGALLGAAARDDAALNADLDRLRDAGNWSFFAPKRRRLRHRLHARIADRLEPPDRASVAGAAVAAGAGDDEGRAGAVVDQVTHWLFAAEAIAVAAYRGLAVLAAHPAEAARAADDADGGGTELAYLRACVLESLRLWPTTPVILREYVPNGAPVPGFPERGGQVILFVPLFHRDPAVSADADRFAPDAWLTAADRPRWPFVPFSGGPAMCPARHLAPMLGAAFLAGLLAARRVTPAPGAPALDPARPLPGTLDPFTLRFALIPRS
jgi:cytochrome P450